MAGQVGARSSLVKLVSKSTAVSAVAVKPGKTHPLSVLDHAMAKHALHLVFYYPRTGAGAFSMDRDRIKESLSDVLSYYPAVTGRLVSGEEGGNWVVRCNDAGVRVLDAEVGVGMEEWFGLADEGQERDLAYWEEMGQNPFIWSPFYIQISEFKDGGVAIGLSCPHMYSDPTSTTLLIKAWADAHRRACIVHPPFFHPPALRGRPNPNTSTGSAALLDSKSKLTTTATSHNTDVEMSTVTFRFDDQAVRRCLAEIKPCSPDATPFDALAALFWWRIGAASLNLCLDFRKRMHAPLPHGFFGNALHYTDVTAGDVGTDNRSWGKLAEAVRVHVAGLEEEEYWSTLDWLEGRSRKDDGKYGEAFQMYGPSLTCVMLDHLFAYEAVFDDKGPAHVSCRIGGQLDGEGVLLILPHPDGGEGRTVMMTLPTSRTDEIRQDEIILRTGATLVFNSNSNS